MTEEDYDIRVDELEELLEAGVSPKGRPWSEDEIALVRRYYQKVPTDQLMKYLPGRSRQAVYHQFARIRDLS